MESQQLFSRWGYNNYIDVDNTIENGIQPLDNIIHSHCLYS